MTYGFKVRREMEWNGVTYTHTDVPTGKWRVELPHQCDAWSITAVAPDWEDSVEREKAIDSLRAFIAEAKEALAALILEEEFGEDE